MLECVKVACVDEAQKCPPWLRSELQWNEKARLEVVDATA